MNIRKFKQKINEIKFFKKIFEDKTNERKRTSAADLGNFRLKKMIVN